MRSTLIFVALVIIAGCQDSGGDCQIAGFTGSVDLKGLLSHADLRVSEQHKVSLTLYAPQTVVAGPLLTMEGQGTCQDGTLSVRFGEADSHKKQLRFVSGNFVAATSVIAEYGHFGLWDIKVEELEPISRFSFAKTEQDGRNYVVTSGSWNARANQP